MSEGKRAGVSYDRLPNGRYRVRWRETERTPEGGEKRVQRSFVVSDEAAAIEAQGRIIRAMERGELFEREPVRVLPKVATVDAVLAGWVRSRRARGIARGTDADNVALVGRALRALRSMHAIDESSAVPGELLCRETVIELAEHLRRHGAGARGLSETSIYKTLCVLVKAWTWAASDEEVYPGLRAAPGDVGDLLPRAPIWAPTEAPSMAEVDAMIRRLPAYEPPVTAQAVAVLARCTGLRVGQVVAIKAADVNLSARTLVVSTGKSRREKAERRTVPLAPVLVDYIAPLVSAAGEGTLIPRQASFKASRAGGPDVTLRKAWQAATDAGEARLEVWAPSNRGHARPAHALRAAFQAHLIEAGVRDEVVDLLVGHAPDLRGRHYVSASSRMGAMREAVALLPEIDWQGIEEADESNVVEMPRRG